MAVEEQVVSIFLGTGGHLDSVPVEDVKRFEAELLDHMKASEEGFLENIRKSQKLGEEDEEKLVDIIDHFKKGFSASGGGSVVPDEHVEALDEDEVGKESVQVKKEKPKDKDSKDSKNDSGESTKASGDSKKESKDSKKDKK
jgi:F-type H+-transporting ATPase subunit alpha